MKNKFIFIDTSIFVEENFLEGSRINTILDLAVHGHLKIVLSIITVNEIKAQFNKRTTIAFEKHNELINDKQKFHIRTLRNNKRGKELIGKLPSLKIISNEFSLELDSRLAASKAIILPYSVIDISGVFGNYFANKPPFGGAEKKHEFPDAFAIIQAEQWAVANKRHLNFLSNDKDFGTLATENLNIVDDYEKFIEERLKEVTEADRLVQLDKLYDIQSLRIDHEITEWVSDQFDDDSLFHDVTNWLEVLDKAIELVEVVEKEYELISVNEENMEIDITATVRYKVVIETYDEGTGIYDKEDGIMLYRETTELDVEQSDLKVSLRISFTILSGEDYDEDYEVLEYNDGKSIKLDPDGYNDYY
ncbi:MAG: hypothetical protein EOP48_00295 [Sphingobacteriales bacterium]|nr:MAG: hypothetical protein EOP48_00295 [Sphingobacteriales bacterium]